MLVRQELSDRQAAQEQVSVLQVRKVPLGGHGEGGCVNFLSLRSTTMNTITVAFNHQNFKPNDSEIVFKCQF